MAYGLAERRAREMKGGRNRKQEGREAGRQAGRKGIRKERRKKGRKQRRKYGRKEERKNGRTDRREMKEIRGHHGPKPDLKCTYAYNRLSYFGTSPRVTSTTTL